MAVIDSLEKDRFLLVRNLTVLDPAVICFRDAGTKGNYPAIPSLFGAPPIGCGRRRNTTDPWRLPSDRAYVCIFNMCVCVCPGSSDPINGSFCSKFLCTLQHRFQKQK